jgi:hypothetical protein
MANIGVKEYARENGVPLWKIARRMRVSENTLYRRLRDELDDDTKKRFFDVVDLLRGEQKI